MHIMSNRPVIQNGTLLDAKEPEAKPLVLSSVFLLIVCEECEQLLEYFTGGRHDERGVH